MAETARAAEATRLLRGIPDEITIWEILVRLPPKSVLRCRAVCPAWRSATSSRDFLLAHHARQPTLPLLYGYYAVGESLGIIPFDHRAGHQQSVARPSHANGDFQLVASCDGLLVLCSYGTGFSFYNPATGEYALLPMLSGFMFLGIYRHQPTGEYRMLLYGGPVRWRAACCIFALGSAQGPRYIGKPPDELNLFGRPVLFSGRLHWHPRQLHNGINVIIVFDTIAESFHQMCAAVVPGRALLFEVDGMLGMSGFNDAGTVIDIWMMEDCETERWVFKCRVELPVAEIKLRCGELGGLGSPMVVSCDGDVLVLVMFGKSLLQVDMDGKLVASFHLKGPGLSQHRLKQTLVPHTLFGAVERHAVNAIPFIWLVVELGGASYKTITVNPH